MLYYINLIFGIIYFIFLLIDIFTQHECITYYSQAYLVGYCLSSLTKETIVPFPVWTALTINAFAIIYDNTIWMNVLILFVEWIHFIILFTIFLVLSKQRLFSHESFEEFQDKWFLLFILLFDLLISQPNLGIIIFIVLSTQQDHPHYMINNIILSLLFIYTFMVSDLYNFSFTIILIINEFLQRRDERKYQL